MELICQNAQARQQMYTIKQEGEEIDFTNFFLFRLLSTAVFLLIFTVIRGELVLPSRPAWIILLVGATVDVIISRVLYYVALRRMRMSFHALLLTLSPVITIFWSLLLFNTWPSLQGFIGGTAVIIGILIVTLRRNNGREVAQQNE